MASGQCPCEHAEDRVNRCDATVRVTGGRAGCARGGVLEAATAVCGGGRAEATVQWHGADLVVALAVGR